MKLLITGGTGFIGSRLALEARQRGLDVVVSGQRHNAAERARAEELSKAEIEIVEGALQDDSYARRITQGCRSVIHLAAAQHEANVPDAHFEAANVGGTRTLLEACRAAGVERFVYGSTIGVYGEATSGVLSETSPPRPMNIYGRTKLAAEGVVQSFTHSPATCIIRISETYGPGDFRLLKLFRAIDRGRFFIIGSGTNRHQVIHVRDLITLLMLATEHPGATGQVIVAAGDEVVTTHDMVVQVAQALGLSPPKLRAPLWPFLALAVAMEMTLTPLGIQPPLHRRRLDFFRKSFLFDTAKARTLLGFRSATTFRDGAIETAQWYREHGYL